MNIFNVHWVLKGVIGHGRAGIFIVALMVIFGVTGCVVHEPARPNDPYYAPVLQTLPVPDEPLNGSLYRENIALSLFDDGKAARVGDIITVVLQESTSSSKTSNVEITKESDTNIAPDAASGTLFGSQPTLRGFGLATSLAGDREFTGEAGADQSNQLSGRITVTVVDVHPNGTLVVRGEKWITLNRGNEFIRISGLVRPQDVTPENTVASNKMANSRITYSGTGELADSQQIGWLARFFNSAIWPF